MFCLKKLKNPALEWKGFSDANIELAKSLRRKYFFIEENTKYVCNTCKIGFPTPAILNCHQKIHLVQHNFRSIIYFYCADCKIGWRIHRHLAKHLGSKSHIMKLENVGKLPIGTYDKLEHSGTDFNLIDTSSCESSLESLKTLAAALWNIHAIHYSKEFPVDSISFLFLIIFIWISKLNHETIATYKIWCSQPFTTFTHLPPFEMPYHYKPKISPSFGNL